jgi:putative oxidoreductase
MGIGLLIMRLAIGLTMAAHGTRMLSNVSGGAGLPPTAAMVEKLGLRPGPLHARVAGVSELVGGLLLALGFLTPLGAAAIIAAMWVAASTVHVGKGFFVENNGVESPVVMAVVALGLAFTGPGVFSLDGAVGLGWRGVSGGLVALVLGVLAGAGHLVIWHPSRLQPAGKKV